MWLLFLRCDPAEIKKREIKERQKKNNIYIYM